MAKKLGLELQASSGPITAAALEGARLLYLRAPSAEFTHAEAAASSRSSKAAARCCWSSTRSGGNPSKRRR